MPDPPSREGRTAGYGVHMTRVYSIRYLGLPGNCPCGLSEVVAMYALRQLASDVTHQVYPSAVDENDGTCLWTCFLTPRERQALCYFWIFLSPGQEVPPMEEWHTDRVPKKSHVQEGFQPCRGVSADGVIHWWPTY